MYAQHNCRFVVKRTKQGEPNYGKINDYPSIQMHYPSIQIHYPLPLHPSSGSQAEDLLLQIY